MWANHFANCRNSMGYSEEKTMVMKIGGNTTKKATKRWGRNPSLGGQMRQIPHRTIEMDTRMIMIPCGAPREGGGEMGKRLMWTTAFWLALIVYMGGFANEFEDFQKVNFKIFRFLGGE